MLVDGHRVNDDVYGQALIGTEFPVDVDLIDRIEVIRGPNSLLYLASAFLGVVNIITKQKQSARHVIASGELLALATNPSAGPPESHPSPLPGDKPAVSLRRQKKLRSIDV